MTDDPDPLTDPKFYRDVTAKRLLAWVVDMLLVSLLAVIIVPFTAFTGLFFFPLLFADAGFCLSRDHHGTGVGHIGHAAVRDRAARQHRCPS